jgi:phosphoadenosine phosphosulfate reductase
VFVDTGYLFPRPTALPTNSRRGLKINLKVYRAAESPAWIEARHGKLWEQGAEGLSAYNQIVKVAPMQRALAELGARAWLAGLGASSRARARTSHRQHPGWPLEDPAHCRLDRSRRHRYLTENDLPYHPLWEKGYVSIGDVHTTRP